MKTGIRIGLKMSGESSSRVSFTPTASDEKSSEEDDRLKRSKKKKG